MPPTQLPHLFTFPGLNFAASARVFHRDCSAEQNKLLISWAGSAGLPGRNSRRAAGKPLLLPLRLTQIRAEFITLSSLSPSVHSKASLLLCLCLCNTYVFICIPTLLSHKHNSCRCVCYILLGNKLG